RARRGLGGTSGGERLLGVLGGAAAVLEGGLGRREIADRRRQLLGVGPLVLQRGALAVGVGAALGETVLAVLGLLALAHRGGTSRLAGGEMIGKPNDLRLALGNRRCR